MVAGMRTPFGGPRGLLILLVLGIVVLGILGWMVLAYNGLVAKDQTIVAQWAQVENQYQRKVDLIPQLVAILQDYSEFERSTLENITRLRSEWQNATSVNQQVNYTNALDQNLYVIRFTYEAYPYLQTIEAVSNVMFSVEGTENRIAVERMRFNEAVRSYNTQIRSFPDNLIAGMFGFQERPYYDPIPGGP